MNHFLEAFSMGTLAGTAPSPHNIRLGLMSIDAESGDKVLAFCLGALALDVLIIALSVGFGGLHGSKSTFTRVLRVAGSLFYLRMAIKILRTSRPPANGKAVARAGRGFLSGAVVQSCNPNPFLFWFLVGGPRVVELYRESSAGLPSALSYVTLFLLCTYGIKLALANGLKRWLERPSSRGRGPTTRGPGVRSLRCFWCWRSLMSCDGPCGSREYILTGA